MKKFCILLFFILLSFNVFAQDKEKNYDIKKVSPWTLGISGFGYFPTSEQSLINNNGGGIGWKFKWNFNRYVGLATELNYTYTYENYFSSLQHIINIREALVIQRETYKGENGFVPWFSIGVGATVYMATYYNTSRYYYNYNIDSAVGFNLNVGAGLKYNFKHFYTGIFVDWTYSIINKYIKDHLDGVRTGIELGFRY